MGIQTTGSRCNYYPFTLFPVIHQKTVIKDSMSQQSHCTYYAASKGSIAESITFQISSVLIASRSAKHRLHSVAGLQMNDHWTGTSTLSRSFRRDGGRSVESLNLAPPPSPDHFGSLSRAKALDSNWYNSI